MRNYILLLLSATLCAASLRAQNGDYETWANQKREQYDKWMKLRSEIVSHLPSNPHQDAIGSFIDQGFAPTKPAQPQQQFPQPQQPQQSQQLPQPAVVENPTNHPPISPPPASTSPNIKIWVVVVGVADYGNERINLHYTDDDAYRMYAFYKSSEGGSLPDNQITVLIDEEATRPNVLQAINETYAKAGKEDVIIFYFSGHGSAEAFITHDYDGNIWDYKGLLLHDELNDVFEASKARYKYIIVDACHSGSSAKSIKREKSYSKGTFYEAFEQSKGGLAMLLSSMSDEVSLETRGVRQGVFSHYLIRGLKGEADKNKDGVVSVVELYNYVEVNVRDYTQDQQNPVLAGNYDEQMPVSVIQ